MLNFKCFEITDLLSSLSCYVDVKVHLNNSIRILLLVEQFAIMSSALKSLHQFYLSMFTFSNIICRWLYQIIRTMKSFVISKIASFILEIGHMSFLNPSECNIFKMDLFLNTAKTKPKESRYIENLEYNETMKSKNFVKNWFLIATFINQIAKHIFEFMPPFFVIYSCLI